MKMAMKLELVGISALACLTMMAATATDAQAGTLSNGWNYTLDAVGDGSPNLNDSNGVFDIKAIAVKQTRNTVSFVLNGNTPLGGTGAYGLDSTGGTIGWGDLFFNFTGQGFQAANASKSLIGIRFASANNSNVGVGVYTGVQALDVTAINHGYSSLNQYYNYGFYKPGTQGDLATQAATDAYYGNGNSIRPVINSGTYAGGLTALTSTAWADLPTTFFSGSQTFGFSFQKPSGWGKNYIANLFLECGNDGVALTNGSSQSVPEPSAVAGLTLFGLVFGGKRVLKGQRKVKAVG